MEKNIDRKSFPRSCVSGDQPASAKIVSFPMESTDRRRLLAQSRFSRGKIQTERNADKEWKETEPANDGFQEPSNSHGERPEGQKRPRANVFPPFLQPAGAHPSESCRECLG